MIPTLGRVLAYKLTAHDAETINKRRSDLMFSGFAHENTGAQCHTGNGVNPGEVYPMIVTRVWVPGNGGAVNGQVLLDGNDALWVTSRTEQLDEETSEPVAGYWAPITRVEA